MENWLVYKLGDRLQEVENAIGKINKNNPNIEEIINHLYQLKEKMFAVYEITQNKEILVHMAKVDEFIKIFETLKKECC